MILKSLLKLFRETFRSKAYCVMTDELENHNNLGTYVVVRVTMPVITIATLILRKRDANWHATYSFRDTVGQLVITTEYPAVAYEEYRSFVQTLEESRHLKNYYGSVKDGVRYEIAFCTENGRMNLTISNPSPHQEHSRIIERIDAKLQYLFGKNKEK